MAEKRSAPSRVAGERQAPPRRNDVIRCEYCGEDYAITYKRCPFCDERPDRGSSSAGSGRRRASNTRGGGYGRPVNPIQIVGLVISMILIIAALFIVFTKLAPLFSKGDTPPASSSVQTDPSGSSSGTTEPTPSNPDPSGSGSQSSEPVVKAQGISLNKQDITLVPGEEFRFSFAVVPANTTEAIVWTSSDIHLASVDQDGTVTNVNMGSTQEVVTITASCGDVSAECIVRCKPGGTAPSGGNSSGGSSSGSGQSASGSAGDTGTVVNAGNGLNVRSGPGSNYEKIASIMNGSKITILENTGNGWYKIDYGNKKVGYVSSDFISVK